MITLSEPYISGNEWKYIKECLDTAWVSSAGGYVSKFEDMVAKYVGSKYAVATVNGTCALHLALIACGIRPEDEVIVPTLTFIAPVNTVKYCQAQPVFMDCDRETLCLDTAKVLEFIKINTLLKKDGFTYNKKTGRRIKAIIPVHVFGHPADIDELIRICADLNIAIVEDATESLGSEYRGRKVAGIGKAGCLSFNGNKIITSGGGGMVLTNDENFAKRTSHLSTQAKIDGIEYDHDEIGYNYRLTNIQAAMGAAQMEKLNEYIDLKRKNAFAYKELLAGIDGVEFLWEQPWAKSNFWFYSLHIPKEQKKPLINYLLANNIEVRPIWKLIHTLPMFNHCQSFAITNAIEAYSTCINLPCSVNLKEADINFVVRKIKQYFDKVK